MNKSDRVTHPGVRWRNAYRKQLLACPVDKSHDMREFRVRVEDEEQTGVFEPHSGTIGCLECGEPLEFVPGVDGPIGWLYKGTLHRVSAYQSDTAKTICGAISESKPNVDASILEPIDYVDDAWRVEKLCKTCYPGGVEVDGVNVEDI